MLGADARDVERRDQVLRVAEAEPEALLVVTGPTGSGKSALALDVAVAIGGEIINADSVQIVRYFDIGSGKPTPAERARVPHHLVDVLEPLDDIDASRFAALADRAIADVLARGKRPILCGGTFLWIRALLFGLVDAPPANDAIRAAHREAAAREGRAALHERLRAVDPEAAARLHPNDLVRVSRALEVFETTGQRLSALQAAHGFREPTRPARLFAVTRDPETLTARMRQRIVEWLDQGWIDEVKSLMGRGFSEARAMSSVGYREVAAHVRGELASGDSEALLEAILRATRVYARRQKTFLKQAPATWL